MLYIGVDLGTSSAKLLLMDEGGNIKNIVTREYPLYFPQAGWAEQNPEDWYSAVVSGIKELVEDFNRDEIDCIGVAGQMHGSVMLDENDLPVRPAILWNDGRTEAETEYLNSVIGREILSGHTGNIAFSGFTAPKFLWMKKNEPKLWAKVKKFMLPKDYINYKLTGVHSCDYSDASGMLLLDVKNKRWSRYMTELCEISDNQLPALYESYDIVGELKPEIAGELGLRKNVRVIAGAGDNAAAAIGTGTIGSGTCNISLGTSGTIFIPTEKFVTDSNNSLHAFAHSDGKYHLMGCMLSAASCNKWWLENILHTNEYTKEQSEIDESELGRNKVYFLPYLMGERAPHNDALARSAFIGMSMNTYRKDMVQAVLEGVAFGIRDSLEAAREMGINITTSMLCGGGAKSPLWRKIFANVLNIELTLPETEQGPGYGAALLAATACGNYRDIEDACKAVIRTKGRVLPDREVSSLYNEKYAVYKELYPVLKPVFQKL